MLLEDSLPPKNSEELLDLRNMIESPARMTWMGISL
jgi:hypothetical protein